MAEPTLKQKQAIAKAKARSRIKSNQPSVSTEGAANLPEFGSLSRFGPLGEQAGTGARLGAAFATTPDVESRKDIIQKAIPGTQFATDEEGNTVIQLPDGSRSVLNSPGLSMQDFADFASDVVKFLPSARFAAGGKTLLRRLVRGGTAATATSAAEDVGAGLQGSEQGLQGGKAGVTAAADVAGETLARPLGAVGRVLKRTFGRRTGEIFDVEGNLTAQAKGALEKAGIDPDQISPDLVRSAIRSSEEGAPAEAVTGIAQSERFGIPLTRGQTTGDFGQTATEEAIRGRADEAGNIVRAFDQRQQEQLIAAERGMSEELGGTQRALESEAEAGARIGGTVRGQAEELERAVSEAYEAVGATDAALTREGLDKIAEVPDLIRNDRRFVIDEGTDSLTPATLKALDELEDLAGEGFNSRTVDEIETARKRLSQFIGTAKNPTDKRNVTAIKKRFDEYLDDAFDNALFSGDEQALELLKNARGLRRAYAERFQEQATRTKSGRKVTDPGTRAVESIIDNNATDEGVVNMLFGRARVFNSENAVKSIRALRRATGNAENVDQTLKQLTFRRISSQAVNNGKFSPRKFVSAFDRVMEQNPGVVREIFTKDELSALKEFRDTTERLIPPDKATNPSGTAAALQRNWQSALSRIGGVLGFTLAPPGAQFKGSSLGRAAGSSAGGAIQRSTATQIATEAVNPQFFLPGRPSDKVIASAIATARQGGPTAVEEGAEAVGSIGQPEGSTGPGRAAGSQSQ